MRFSADSSRGIDGAPACEVGGRPVCSEVGAKERCRRHSPESSTLHSSKGKDIALQESIAMRGDQ